MERSRPRPPPLSLFPKPDRSSLPYLQGGFSPSLSTANTIESFAATGSIVSSWGPLRSPRTDGVEYVYDEQRQSWQSMVMRSRWSSDSGSDYSVEDSPFSPTFVHKNQNPTNGQLSSSSSSSIRPSPISSFPSRRRSSTMLRVLSPHTIPWSPPKISNGRRSGQNQAQENISPQLPFRHTLRNSDGSWKVVDAHGKFHVIPALPPTGDVKQGDDLLNEDRKWKESGEDVQWQFRHWRGFQAQGKQS